MVLPKILVLRRGSRGCAAGLPHVLATSMPQTRAFLYQEYRMVGLRPAGRALAATIFEVVDREHHRLGGLGGRDRRGHVRPGDDCRRATPVCARDGLRKSF